MAETDGALHELEPTARELEKQLALSETTETIETDTILATFKAINVFLAQLGTVFAFMTKDVSSKISIIEKYREQRGDESKTILGLVKYEVSNDLTNNTKEKSACRTLLRLDRALEFITLFLQRINDSSEQETPSTLASEAYSETLSNHHPWLTRGAVTVALKMLPNREDFLQRVYGKRTEAEIASMKEICTIFSSVHERIHALFKDHDLLALP